MIYEPTTTEDWQHVNRLLLSDPVLYSWMYWLQEEARERIRMSPIEITRDDGYDLSKTVWRAHMRFVINDVPPLTPFVPPHAR